MTLRILRDLVRAADGKDGCPQPSGASIREVAGKWRSAFRRVAALVRRTAEGRRPYLAFLRTQKLCHTKHPANPS